MNESITKNKIWSVPFTLQDFINQALNSREDPKTYIFRGESVLYDEPLRPLFQRHFQDLQSITTKELLSYEQAVWKKFKAKAYAHISTAFLPDSKIQFSWWPIMNHYGAPTRLLTWSYSPLVAAYFSCNANPSGDGCIWFLDVAELQLRMDSLHKIGKQPGYDHLQLSPSSNTIILSNNLFLNEMAPPVIIAGKAYPETLRMSAQQTLFTSCMNLQKVQFDILCDVFSGSLNQEKPFFGQIIIKAKDKLEFLEKLFTFNTNANSLFPGIENLGIAEDEMLRIAVGLQGNMRHLFS